MSRLIDADAWIEKLSNSFTTPNYHPDLGDAFQCIDAEQHNEDIYDLITEINKQPTAYSIDMVVKELENCKKAYPFGTWFDMIEEAIAIVKGE
jgi:hypothetical protein